MTKTIAAVTIMDVANTSTNGSWYQTDYRFASNGGGDSYFTVYGSTTADSVVIDVSPDQSVIVSAATLVSTNSAAVINGVHPYVRARKAGTDSGAKVILVGPGFTKTQAS